MPIVHTHIDTDYLISEHFTKRRTLQNLADEHGVTHKVIARRIRIAGFTPVTRMIDFIDKKRACNLFAEGFSTNEISKQLGVGRKAIDAVLKDCGITPRSSSDAERIKWSRMTKDKRSSQVKAAHDAVRGMKRSNADRCLRAIGCQLNPKIWPPEAEFAALLKSYGVDCTHQFAVGPYNCDLMFGSIAVEIQCTTGSSSAISSQGKRTRYILDAGFDVIFVFADRFGRIGDGAAKYVIANINGFYRDGTVARQYRMVGGTGELISAGGLYLDDAAIVAAFKDSLKFARRKHHRVWQ